MSKNKKPVSKKDQPISMREAVQKFINHSDFAQHIRANDYVHDALNKSINDLVRRVYKIETYLQTYGAPANNGLKGSSVDSIKISAKNGQFKKYIKRYTKLYSEKYIDKYLKKYLMVYFRDAVDDVVNAIFTTIEDEEELDAERNAECESDSEECGDGCCTCCSIHRIDPSELPEEVQKGLDKVLNGLFGNNPYVPRHGDIVAIISGEFRGYFGEVDTYDEETSMAHVLVSNPTSKDMSRIEADLSRDIFIVVGTPMVREDKTDNEKDDENDQKNNTDGCESMDVNIKDQKLQPKEDDVLAKDEDISSNEDDAE